MVSSKSARKPAGKKPARAKPAKPAEANDTEWTLSNKEFASLCGITIRRVNMLVKEGVLRKTGGSRIPADQMLRFIDYQVSLAVSKVAREDDPLELERLRKIRLQNDETEGKLIPVEEAVEAVSVIFGPVQSEIMSIPSRVTDDVEIRKSFEIEADQAFNSLADRFKEVGSALRSGRDFISETEEDDAVDLGK